ncbi:tetratricopeptide repeat protein, partial [Novipirellula herctigrandis]|uniref:tetratricopeptide repeat protein n=1 Tax=Novipirellula herctigrandis TaxID=2527986 RepID=UPI003AF3FD02
MNSVLFCWMVVVSFSIVAIGCDQGESLPNARELAQRQQLKESTALSKTKTKQERLDSVKAFLKDGNVVAAANELRPLVFSDAEDPEVAMLMAQCEVESGNLKVAVQILDGIGSEQPKFQVDALWLAASTLIEAEAFEEAEKRLQRLLTIDPNPIKVHRELASLLNDQGRRIEAAVHMRALAESGEIGVRELYALTTLGDAFIDDSYPKQLAGRNLAPAALGQARYFRANGDLQQTNRLCKQLWSAFPDLTPIAAFTGRVFAEQQDDEGMNLWFNHLPESIEKEPEYWFALGLWLQRHSMHRQAVRCFCEAVLRDETDRFSYLGLAQSLLPLEQNEVVERVAERAKWLTESARLAKKFGLQPGSKADLLRMVEVLDKLDRPHEALGWLRIEISRFGESEESRRYMQRFTQSAASFDETSKRQRVLCGIDVNQWPLPDMASLKDSEITPESGPTVTASEISEFRIKNVSTEAKLEFQYDNSDDPKVPGWFLHQVTGGGIGVVDFDLNGWPDLYFTQGGGEPFGTDDSKPNPLFRNCGGKYFVDVNGLSGPGLSGPGLSGPGLSGPGLSGPGLSGTGDRGYGQGVAVADINQDGFPDLVVANIGRNLLYCNQGDGTFLREVLPIPSEAQTSMAIGGAWTSSIACGDLSGDHLPEIVELNYIDDPLVLQNPCVPDHDICNPSGFKPATDTVWQTQPDGKLKQWDGCQEMRSLPNYGFGAVIANFDQKGGNDEWHGRKPLRTRCSGSRPEPAQPVVLA